MTLLVTISPRQLAPLTGGLGCRKYKPCVADQGLSRLGLNSRSSAIFFYRTFLPFLCLRREVLRLLGNPRSGKVFALAFRAKAKEVCVRV